MTYRGTIKQGVVVLDEAPSLKEGTRVAVQLLDEAEPPPTSGHFHPVGSWEGPPGELDRLLAEVQELRDADIALEGNRGDDDSVPA
jgi:hypothetical protein